MKYLQGKITITRPNGYNCDYIEIQLKDVDSQARFVSAKVKYEDLMLALTGLSAMPCNLEVNALDKVGKQIQRKALVFPLPKNTKYRDREFAKAIAKDFTDDGWTADLFFSSQDSFFIKDGINWAKTHQYRYVENNGKDR